jgi:hypothetical protein
MANKANTKAQTTLKGVKQKLDAGFRSSDVCLLSSSAGENRETSFGSPNNQPDEATIFLDVKPINLV